MGLTVIVYPGPNGLGVQAHQRVDDLLALVADAGKETQDPLFIL
jgi:hypothetical protein